MWARSAINVAATREDVERLVKLVDGAERVGDFELDQEMRWAMAIKAVAFGLPDADDAAGASRRSATGPTAAAARCSRAEASRPTDAAKAEAWERIHGEGYGSFHLTRAAMLGFFWPQQQDLLEPYVDRFFDQVRDVFETRDHPFARAYLLASTRPTAPIRPCSSARAACWPRSTGRCRRSSRQLAEVADELDRQIKVRDFAAEAPSSS